MHLYAWVRVFLLVLVLIWNRSISARATIIVVRLRSSIAGITVVWVTVVRIVVVIGIILLIVIVSITRII